MFWILIPYQRHGLKYFIPFCVFLVYSVDSVFDVQNFKIFMNFNLSIFSFVTCTFSVISKISLTNPMLSLYNGTFHSEVIVGPHAHTYFFLSLFNQVIRPIDQ